MSFARIFQLWDEFWFTDVSPQCLALFRILFGLLLLQFALFLFPDLFIWYGPRAIISANSISEANPTVVLDLLNMAPQSSSWLLCIYGAFIVAATCLTLGFCTRLACAICFVMLTTFYHHNPYLLNSGDSLMRLLAFWLIFTDSGAIWSIDDKLARKKPNYKPKEKIAGWGVRCLQLQLVVVYYHAFVTKSPGWVWASGSAVYFAARLENLSRFPFPLDPNIDWVSSAWTWGTLFIEFCLFTLIWIKELRYYMLGMALCLHLCIDWTMNIPQFEWVMMATLILFVYPNDLTTFLNWLKTKYSIVVKKRLPTGSS